MFGHSWNSGLKSPRSARYVLVWYYVVWYIQCISVCLACMYKHAYHTNVCVRVRVCVCGCVWVCEQDKQHFLLVDMAYQGFASGDLERDAAGLRHLVKDGHKVILCQSFSKNMGLYGEQVPSLAGTCMVTCWFPRGASGSCDCAV